MIDENVKREIINHSSLSHPNIVRFKEVIFTPTFLAIVMEYASGGELFERISNAGHFTEDEARYFFQQLISGVSYCHAMQVCHRNFKLENTLLDGSSELRLKICDFGYSKSSVLHSQPKSTVGTPAYIAPEVLLMPEYVGGLHKLRCLDISDCVNLNKLPKDIGDLHKLEKLYLKGCSGLSDLPYSVMNFKHLKHEVYVICDEERVSLWEQFPTIPNLKIEMPKVDISLNWLHGVRS